MKRILVLATLAALSMPAVAGAGGWATISVSADDDVAVGVARETKIKVMQHGRTPLDGVTPIVRISRGGTTRDFTATPTGGPGEYRAKVVYPDAGRWNVEVDDGFSQTHRIMPVDVSGTAAAVADSSGSKTAALVAGGAVVVVILGVAGFLLFRSEPRAGGRGPRRSRQASAS